MKSNINLLAGETFRVQKNEVAHLNMTDDEINNKYKRGEIRIVTEQARYPLDSIQTMIDSKKYILNPEYQRRKRWNNVRKSRLIESFIMNVPIPPIFLYEIDYSIYEVMDGLQRLTAIYDFYNGEFSLEGLEYWQELNHKRYADLPEQVRRGVDRRYLSSVVLLQETAKNKEEAESLKQIVFERLNSGGEKLTAQETRNALRSGKFNDLCLKLSNNLRFREMLNFPLDEKDFLKSESYRKMEDVELVLRFFAYRHIEHLNISVDQFLDEYLRQANLYNDSTIEQLENLFCKTIDVIYEVFGKDAFVPPRSSYSKKNPVKNIYDPMMQSFAEHTKYIDKILENKDDIKKTIYEFPDSLEVSNHAGRKRSLFDGRYNNKTDVQSRIQYFANILSKYIN
jgi:Protein of unknown function DUF262